MKATILEFASLTLRGSRLAAPPVGEYGFSAVRGERLTMRGLVLAEESGHSALHDAGRKPGYFALGLTVA